MAIIPTTTPQPPNSRPSITTPLLLCEPPEPKRGNGIGVSKWGDGASKKRVIDLSSDKRNDGSPKKAKSALCVEGVPVFQSLDPLYLASQKHSPCFHASYLAKFANACKNTQPRPNKCMK
jgi:hypothetical protein